MEHAFRVMADKVKAVVHAASAFANDLVEALPSAAVPVIVSNLCKADGIKWQGSLLKMQLLLKMAAKSPDEIARQLTSLVPMVAKLMWHDKPVLKEAAIAAMTAISRTVENRDIEESIDELIQRLAGIIFVQEIKSEALSVMLPVLTRSLAAQTQIKTKRMAARVVDNMSKLVDEPKECQVFLPKVLPLLERAMEDVPDPECREVCNKAFNQLKRSGDMSKAAKGPDFAAAIALLGGDESTSNVFLAHLIVCLADLKNFDTDAWKSLLSPYLAADKIIEIAAVAEKNDQVEEEAEDDDDAELLCDCNFSLAFGSKILMNNAKLRL